MDIHPSLAVKIQAIQALEKETGYDETLEYHLTNNDSTIQYCAIVGLLNRNQNKYFYAAEYTAKSKQGWLRGYTATFISKFNTVRSNALLKSLLNDSEESVRRSAQIGLKIAKD